MRLLRWSALSSPTRAAARLALRRICPMRCSCPTRAAARATLTVSALRGRRQGCCLRDVVALRGRRQGAGCGPLHPAAGALPLDPKLMLVLVWRLAHMPLGNQRLWYFAIASLLTEACADHAESELSSFAEVSGEPARFPQRGCRGQSRPA